MKLKIVSIRIHGKSTHTIKLIANCKVCTLEQNLGQKTHVQG